MHKSRLVFALLLVVSVAGSGGASASDSSIFAYHIADALLQGVTGVPQTGAVAVASNGHRVRVTGSGYLDTTRLRANGKGTFVHTDETGAVAAFGAWWATGLHSATIYACGGGTVPAEVCGGVVTLKVRVAVTSLTRGQLEVDGSLTIDSEVNAPTPGVEGIKANIPAAGTNFDATLFSRGGRILIASRSSP